MVTSVRLMVTYLLTITYLLTDGTIVYPTLYSMLFQYVINLNIITIIVVDFRNETRVNV